MGFETYTQDADLAPFFKGLPDDECQCEHLGYVIKGKVAFRSVGGEEVFETGDAYYAGPGHTPVLYAGTEVSSSAPRGTRTDHGRRHQEHGGDGSPLLLSGCPGAPPNVGARAAVRVDATGTSPGLTDTVAWVAPPCGNGVTNS